MIRKILALILLVHIGLILYANHALYFSKFDEPYWKDKYEHSQWKLPLSVRTVGDDGLYLYEGFRLIKGGDPTLLNAEVPPLGKYLIGLSILTFGNGHWYGFVINILVLLTLFLLSRKLLNTTLALIVTALVATDPLITSQFPLTMLDSLQLLFLLLTFLLLLQKRYILAGLAFGFFSETKFPILSVPVFILIALFLKSKKPILQFLFASTVAYIIPYTQYFLLGHNILDLLRVQKWIAAFYAQSKLAPNIGSNIAVLLTGWYQNLFTKAWVHAPEWSPVWAIITPLAIISAFRSLRNSWFPLASFALFSLVFFAIIPFWTRYLVLLLPFFYLLAARYVQSIPIIIILILTNLVISIGVLFPTTEKMLSQLSYDWQYGFFHDIYEATSNTNLSREEFRRLGQQFFAQAEIESIAITMNKTKLSRFKSPQNIHVKITYFTRHLGSFTEEKTIQVVKENGQWRIPWKWNYLVDGFHENSKLETTVEEARRGSILASDKTKLAEDFDSVMIWATPGLLDKSKEEDLLKLLWDLFDHNIAHIAFHQRIIGNTQPDIPIPLGVLNKPSDDIKKFPGITLTPHLARRYGKSNIVTIGEVENRAYFECCSWLYTTTNYDGIDGIEKVRNSELKGINGGTLVIKDKDGSIVRTILDIQKQDGKDVQL